MAIDLSGQRFGQLTVLCRDGTIGHSTAWLCRCACGTEKTIRGDVFRRGEANGCGCLRKNSHRIHGRRRTREYFAWCAAKQRCTNPKDPRYRSYGGRGVYMCRRWMHSFVAFFEDMGPCPPGHTLDRENSNGPYSPRNARWLPASKQSGNRTTNHLLTIKGRRYTIADAGRLLGVKPATLSMRLLRGWTPERAVRQPVQH